jgi:DNA helicase II / ATP-dependent DNA helicase PcrA
MALAPIAKESAFPLNAEQRAAVEHGDGPLLVVAGAGTGKTRVITERIRNLLESRPDLEGENILALTFTDKTAGEMKHRVVKAIGDRAQRVWLSTFHAFCLEKILRVAKPDIQPLEDIDHRILLRRNIAELGLVIFRRLAEPAEFLKDFQAFFSRCQDELVTPDDYQQYVNGLRRDHQSCKHKLEPDARTIAEQQIAQQEELARVYRVSDRLLRERNLCTFGAQLLRAVELLRADAELLTRMRQQYRYILVDEFQDTNIAQLELLWLLAGERRNVLAVGDDDQAIYRFRGASFGSFTIFLRKFCGVTSVQDSGAARKFLVSLSQNYRSTQRILRVATEAISHNEKSPWLPSKILTTENAGGERIRVAEFGSADEEAQWVAAEIERLHAAGAPWRSFAVLYRKHVHRAQLLGALRHRGIPFVVRRSSILSSTIVRDLLAWLRLIAVPADNISCARVLAASCWGLQPRDLVRLAERAEKNRHSIWDEVEAAAREAAEAGTQEKAGRPRFQELAQFMDEMRQIAKNDTAAKTLDNLIDGLAIVPMRSEIDRQHVDRLVQFLNEWQRKSEAKNLHDFVEYLNFFDELEGEVQIDEEIADDAVQLMTVHAAKGLEFPHVFIPRLNRNDFPSGARRPQFEFPPELMKEEQPKGDFQKQEERRLFYVALTRAQKRLTLSTIVALRKRPSPFLEDILGNANIQKTDIAQFAPKVEVPPSEETPFSVDAASDSGWLFPASTKNSKAYSEIAVWAKSYHPPRPEPLQVSASAIESYEQCAMKYLFRHVWRIRSGPSAQMTFGNVMHTTIREFVAGSRKRGCMPLEELLAIYDREWKSAGFPDQYQEDEYRKAGHEQLQNFHRHFSSEAPDVLHQEKSFELLLDGDIVVTGRIDQVNRLDGRSVEIVDYKTGKVRSPEKTANDIQLSVYALAATEVFALKPERLVFHYLMTGETVACSRDRKALAAAKERIAIVANQIRAGEFSPEPKKKVCDYCDFKPLCPAHEQLIPL